MVRKKWVARIEAALKKRSVVWLSGLRRIGKTTLVKSLKQGTQEVEYRDCEVLRVREALLDPEFFFSKFEPGALIVLDEIHKLADPAGVLKVAADHFPGLKVIATGSSTLGAKLKFSDVLTDRKVDVWLTPVILSELELFGVTLDERMLYGGLPRYLLEKNADEADRLDWLEQFWAKDIAELFRIEKRHSFLTFCQLLLAQSGGAFEANHFSTPCEVSRQTIMNYLSALETVHFAHVIRPFTAKKSQEILTQPKVYGPDTGFVCAFTGIDQLRESDRGILLEHLVLNEIHGCLGRKDLVHYWRTKQGLELDFVLRSKIAALPVVIECKVNHRKFDPKALIEFRGRYSAGARADENWVVCLSLKNIEETRIQISTGQELIIKFVPLEKLAGLLEKLGSVTSPRSDPKGSNRRS